MVLIEQLTADIVAAIDKFEKETGILITSIEQKHHMLEGVAVVYERKILTSIVEKN